MNPSKEVQDIFMSSNYETHLLFEYECAKVREREARAIATAKEAEFLRAEALARDKREDFREAHTTHCARKQELGEIEEEILGFRDID